jgi:hypothetical protein
MLSVRPSTSTLSPGCPAVIPATLASFSRASGRSVNLPVSKSTSDRFTIRPLAVSRVCRIALNCWSSLARSSAFSRAARSSSFWAARILASFSCFRRSASVSAAVLWASFSRLKSDRPQPDWPPIVLPRSASCGRLRRPLQTWRLLLPEQSFGFRLRSATFVFGERVNLLESSLSAPRAGDVL